MGSAARRSPLIYARSGEEEELRQRCSPGRARGTSASGLVGGQDENHPPDVFNCRSVRLYMDAQPTNMTNSIAFAHPYT